MGVLDLKADNNTVIRQKVLPDSITTANVADRLDAIAEATAEPMDVFLIAGQSNGKGKGNGSLSPDPQPGTVFHYYLDAFSQVTNEVGAAETGSAWPSFGITWKQVSGRKICFVPRAVNSTALSATINNFGSGNWSPSGTHFPASVIAVQDAMTAIAAAGYLPVFRGVLWSQGETDAIAVNNATTTPELYVTQLLQLIADYRSEFGSDMLFAIMKTGTRTDESDIGYAAIRAAQEEVILSDVLRNKMGYRRTVDFPGLGYMSDVVHYSQIGYNEIGREMVYVILGGKEPL